MNEGPTAGDEVADLRRRVEQADQRTFEFVARLAHELRGPLGAILMWTHVLRAARDADRIPALDAIEVSARAQSKLIETLLDVARGLAGHLPLRRSLIDLRVPIRAAIDALRPVASVREVTVTDSIDGAAAMEVNGDPTRICQVVSNLIDNGIKFTPPGGSVDVRLVRAAGAARIVVRDTGRGLRPEMLADVFAAFRSPIEGDVHAVGSLGLGLAFVRLVAELHGGIAFAESDGPGRGATFTIELPLSAAPGATSRDATP